jgi:outer membrane immunogenic protein
MLLAVVGATAALSGTAQAEDWSGFYAGGSISASSRDTEWVDVDGDWGDDGQVISSDSSSFLSIGVQGGYDWQFGNWVIGVAGEVSLSNASNTYRNIPCDCVEIENEIGWLGSLRANAGYSFGAWMPYATLGVAYSDLGYTWTEDGDPDDSWPQFDAESGIVYGVGFKGQLGGNWVMGVEAARYDVGEASSINVDGYQMDVDTNIDTVRFTLDYSFR